MSLPTTFAALTTATGQQLDNNFSALGALTPIPCSVSGTNAITMITALNTPSVPSYANYAVFSGVAAATNTGGTTVAVNSLSALTVYKDTVAGPVALSGGEIVAGNVLYLIYDSALHTGAGGFHLNSQPTNFVYPVGGSSSRVAGSSAGSVLTAAWTANELVAEITLGGLAVKGAGLSLVFNGGIAGANGMDTGSMPASSQLAIYAIYNPTTGNWATLGYTAGSSVVSTLYPGTHLPSGYTYSTLLWVGVTTASSQLPAFVQRANWVYVGPTIVLSAAASSLNTYASLSLAAVVPYSAVATWGTMGGTSLSATQLAVAASNTGQAAQYMVGASAGVTLDGFANASQFTDLPLVTPQTIWWKSANTLQNNDIAIGGYSF
jgi:hypothetical protein